ncbi:hypothetical protein ACFC1T_08680 [Kitasatospora sp. NPDC056076]|uniref:hypothetical protein n=1 Tax=Kitasatospora sp. NPDC056076 TaxID=3345703 RepID=UPI0035D5AA69
MDDAPWFDRSRPESARVLGFYGLSIEGIGSAPSSRSTTSLITDGSLLGPLRFKHREMRFKVLVVSLDDCAASYALEYLAAALHGTVCGDTTCTGDTMCVWSCCPDCTSASTEAPGTRQLRTLYDVGLIDGPHETDRSYMYGPGAGDRGCSGPGCNQENPVFSNVEFTVAAGKPWLFHQPVSSPASGWVPLANGQLLTNFDPDAVLSQCPKPVDCTLDPNCILPPLPPLPPLPVDDCYPRGPMTARRTMLTIRAQEVPEWLESVPVVQLFTGTDKPLRRLTVRFYANPIATDCSASTPDPCTACADINIAYLPPNSNAVIDGRTQRASVDCSGGLGRVNLVGPLGAAFEWPVFACGSGWCVEIISSSDLGTGAQVRVQLAARSDAA